VAAKWHERLRQWFADRRRGGRLPRVARRALAAGLVITAGLVAVAPKDTAAGSQVLAFSRDLPIGARVEERDVQPVQVAAPPDGAQGDPAAVIGAPLASAARRGEIVTDVRLADVAAPDPGPGRVAVPIRPVDAAVADLLGPGMHVAVLSVGPDHGARVLAPDAVVLALGAPPRNGGGDRPIVIAVPTASADAVVGANAADTIAIRFT
jgi:hypothetical protein